MSHVVLLFVESDATGWKFRRKFFYDGGRKAFVDKLLKARDARLAMVSILEVAGSRNSRDDIVRFEELWKLKLVSKAYDLNLSNIKA